MKTFPQYRKIEKATKSLAPFSDSGTPQKTRDGKGIFMEQLNIWDGESG